MLGLPSGQVIVLPYDPGWQTAFNIEKERILHACPNSKIEVEHVGSTAVPGLCAKPILDIMIGIPNGKNGLAFVSALEELGYFYKGENGIPGRHYFTYGTPRIHHIHMVEYRGDIWTKHLLFRDYLRSHPDTLAEYARLKLALSKTFPSDRLQYTGSKHDLIQLIHQKARKEYTNLDKNE